MADDTTKNKNNEEPDEWITPTPLSDPVLTAIFQNAEVSALAMKSLLNAVLMDSGDTPISEVVSVVPQAVHSDTSPRGFRVDVKATTAAGEIAIVEVQLQKFTATVERGLLYAEQALASTARRGEKLPEVISAMPKVIVVHVLEKALREEGGYHQVVELAYREPPYRRATDRLSMHVLELDKYREEKIKNPAVPLECWLTAICISQDEKKPLTEVVKMIPELQEYYDDDPGFAQFVERHGVVAAMPDVRTAYRRWEYDRMLDKLDEERKEEQRAAHTALLVAEGIEQGKAEGREEGVDITMDIMNALLSKGSIDEVAARFNMPIEKVNQVQSLLDKRSQ